MECKKLRTLSKVSLVISVLQYCLCCGGFDPLNYMRQEQ